MQIAILGLGEAGAAYADGLAEAGHTVLGYDPAPVATPGRTHRMASIGEAVGPADLVLSLTGAQFAQQAARQAATALGSKACFAEVNSAAPATKQAVAQDLSATTTQVADVAVLAPIPRQQAATPLLVSGSGASTVAGLLRPVGARVQVLDAPVGAAAGRKLLRSVFMKGLAATVLEAVSAGAAAGCEEWVREQIAAELGPDGPALVTRLVTGTRTHATRRLHEMHDSRAYLRELATSTRICDATIDWLQHLAEREEEPASGDSVCLPTD